MMRSSMRWPVLVLLGLLLAPVSLRAQQDPAAQAAINAQVQRVQGALDRINMEQRSVYQQFQMVQEMRRNDTQQAYQSSLVYTPPATPPNYDDLVRYNEEREARLRQQSEELERLYARYRELEEQKRPLLDELAALAVQGR